MTNLTHGETDSQKILLGNIATVPFQELYDVLSHRSRTELADLAKQLQELPPGSVSGAQITAFFKVWAALDAKAAFAAATDFKTLQARSVAFEAIIDGCQPGSTASVVSLLSELPVEAIAGGLKEHLFSKGIVKWSQVDPAAAVQFLYALYPAAIDQLSNLSTSGPPPGYLLHTLIKVAENWGAKDPQAALAWAEEKRGSEKTSALQHVVNGWWQKNPAASQAYVIAHADSLAGQNTAGNLAHLIASRDPEEAARWAAQLPVEARAAANMSIAESWAAKDPKAATKWAAGLSGTDRESVIGALVLGWDKNDSQGAAQWINSLTGVERDYAVATFSSGIAATDPATALTWALSVSDPQMRTQAAGEIIRRWMAQNPPAAQAWMQRSSLSPAEKTQLLGIAPQP